MIGCSSGRPSPSYGWGSFVAQCGPHLVVGHGGGRMGSGIDNGFRHFTDGSYTVVVLTNIDPPVATDITRTLGVCLQRNPRPGASSHPPSQARLARAPCAYQPDVPLAGGAARQLSPCPARHERGFYDIQACLRTPFSASEPLFRVPGSTVTRPQAPRQVRCVEESWQDSGCRESQA